MLNKPLDLSGPDIAHVVSAIVISGEGDTSGKADSTGRILLSKRGSSVGLLPGQWCFPSGHCKRGETPTAALKREIREELGIEATSIASSPILEAFSIVRQIDPKGRVYFQPYALSVYFVRDWTGIPHNNEPDKCDGIQWMDLSRVVALEDKATVIDAVLSAVKSNKQRLLLELGSQRKAEFISSITEGNRLAVSAIFDILSAWEEGSTQYTLEGCMRLFDGGNMFPNRLFRHGSSPSQFPRFIPLRTPQHLMRTHPSANKR